MGTGKSRSSKSLLGFIGRFSPWNTEDQSSLIPSCRSRRNTIPIVPSPMNTFAGIEKIQFHNLHSTIQHYQPLLKQHKIIQKKVFSATLNQDLIRESCSTRHNNCPSASSSSHGSYIKSFPPFFIYPLEWKRVADFIGLLAIWST